MLSLHPGQRLIAATHNPGKAREIAALLEGRFELIAAGELGLPEPEETESTFIGNAVLKARAAADASGLSAIADDSGLSVAALDGAPGVLSARWAETGTGRDFGFAMRRLEDAMRESGSADAGAWFTCALAVAWPNGPAVSKAPGTTSRASASTNASAACGASTSATVRPDSAPSGPMWCSSV